MSCGDPHDVDCQEVLSKVFEFLDSECAERDRTHIAQHLDECGPCLQLFGNEQEIKALVRRKCGGDPTPAGLRERVRLRLRTVTAETGYLPVDAEHGYRTARTVVEETGWSTDPLGRSAVSTTRVETTTARLETTDPRRPRPDA